MRRELKELLTSMKKDIIDSMTDGCLRKLLAELAGEFTKEDSQQIKCDLNNHGVDRATDTFIDRLRLLRNDAFTIFIVALSKIPQAGDVYNKLLIECRNNGMEHLFEERPNILNHKGNPKEIACSILQLLKPQILETLTEGQFNSLLRELEAELTADDVQYLKSQARVNGSNKGLDTLVDLVKSKKAYMIFVKYMHDNVNTGEIYEAIEKQLHEHGLAALLPKKSPVEQESGAGNNETLVAERHFPVNEEESQHEENEQPVSVPVSPAPNVHDRIEKYKMSDRPPRGICLIINNHDFTKARIAGLNLNDREGSNIDERNLTEVFRWLGFHVETHENVTALELCNALIECKNSQHYDCLVVCILTHGTQQNNLDMVCGVDGKSVPLDYILSLFNGENCSALAGKPKLFFLQCCRGLKEDVIPIATVGGGNVQHDGPSNTDSMPIAPIQSDFFIGYSTPPGYKSFRNTEFGSWYISKLCEVFKDMAKDHDLMTMMTTVNREVSKFYTDNHCKQVPNPSMTLTKQLYFIPIADSERGQKFASN
eukprot:gene15864-17462_t